MTARKYILALLLALGVSSFQPVNATPVQVIAAGPATHTSQDHNVSNPFVFAQSASVDFQALYKSDALDDAQSAFVGVYPLEAITGGLIVDGVSAAFAGRTTGLPGCIVIDSFPGAPDYQWAIIANIVFEDAALGEADLRAELRGTSGDLGSVYGDTLIPPPEILLPGNWAIVLQRYGSPSISGIRTLDMHAVPEPATFALLVLGIAGLAVAGKRRSVGESAYSSVRTRVKRHAYYTVLLASTASVPSAVGATPVLYDFTGEVTWTHWSPLPVGSHIAGTFHFDPSAVTSTVYDWYFWHPPGTTARLTVSQGAVAVSTDGVVAMQVFDGTPHGYGYDSLTVSTNTTDRATGDTVWSHVRIGFSLRDFTGSVFDGRAIPPAIVLTDFTETWFGYQDLTASSVSLGFGLGYEFSGIITSWSRRQQVSTSDSLSLLTLGLAGLGYSRRWR